MNIYSFLLTSIIIILLPGTGVLYTISVSFTHKKSKGILAAFGCTLGILPHLFFSLIISAVFLTRYHMLFVIIKWIGILYILYLGIAMLLSHSRITPLTEDIDDNDKIITHSILINLLNPKLTIFFFTFLPQYTNPESSYYSLSILGYGFLFMFLTFLIFVLYALLANFAKQLFLTSKEKVQYFTRFSGILFLLFGIYAIIYS